MKSLHKKRQAFHVEIRKKNVELNRRVIRKQFIAESHTAMALNQIQSLFSSLPSNSLQGSLLSTQQTVQTLSQQSVDTSATDLEIVCESIKEVISQHQDKDNKQVERSILQYLSHKLPPIMFESLHWPRSFLDLALHIFGSNLVNNYEKQLFGHQLKCIQKSVKYIVNNWTEIKQNHCHDEYVKLFNQAIQYGDGLPPKNFSQIHEIQVLISEILESINKSTEAKRKSQRLLISMLFDTNDRIKTTSFDLLDQNLPIDSYEISTDAYEQCKQLQLMANFHLLLPVESFFNKENARVVLQNVRIFYKSIFLNSNLLDLQFTIKRSLCILISVCTGFTVPDDRFMILKLIEESKYRSESKSESFQQTAMEINSNNLSPSQPRSTALRKNEQSLFEYEYSSLKNISLIEFGSCDQVRIELSMLYQVSLNQGWLRFEDIEGWIFVKFKQWTMIEGFGSADPSVMRAFICLLINLMQNQRNLGICSDCEKWAVSIFNFFEIEGFEQLFMTELVQNAADLLIELIKCGQEYCGMESYGSVKNELQRFIMKRYLAKRKVMLKIAKELFEKRHKKLETRLKEKLVLQLLLNNEVDMTWIESFTTQYEQNRINRFLSASIDDGQSVVEGSLVSEDSELLDSVDSDQSQSQMEMGRYWNGYALRNHFSGRGLIEQQAQREKMELYE